MTDEAMWGTLLMGWLVVCLPWIVRLAGIGADTQIGESGSFKFAGWWVGGFVLMLLLWEAGAPSTVGMVAIAIFVVASLLPTVAALPSKGAVTSSMGSLPGVAQAMYVSDSITRLAPLSPSSAS